jgi:hypothetical protein
MLQSQPRVSWTRDHQPVRLSRRNLLSQGVACAVGGALANQLLARRAAAAAKMQKYQAGYKDAPRGSMRCERCVQFQPPAACKIVDGAISPAGSCDLFAPKG